MIYSPLSAFLVRVPILESGVFVSTAKKGVVAEYAKALKKQAKSGTSTKTDTDMILDSLMIANPKFVENLKAGNGSKGQYLRSALLQYLIRMSTRTTPFGLFAAVGIGTFSNGSSMRFTNDTTFRVRADMGWISNLSSKVESEDIPGTSFLTMNGTATRRSGRIFISDSLPFSTMDKNAPKSIKETGPVKFIFDTLKDRKATYRDISKALADKYGDIKKVDKLLHNLISESFVITDIRPPLTEADPLLYLSTKTKNTNTGDAINSVMHSISELNEVQHNNFQNTYYKIIGGVGKLTGDVPECILRAETALNGNEVKLPDSVGRDAAELAELMLNMSIFHKGFPWMEEYRDKFIEEYGYSGIVNLLELFDDGIGIGSPYKGNKRMIGQSVPSRNVKAEEMLFGFVSDSLKNRSLAMALSNKQVNALKTWNSNYEEAPLSMNLNINICSKNETALNSGDYKLAASSAGGNKEALSSISRVADVIGLPAEKYSAEIVDAEEALSKDEVLAELFSYPEHRNISDLEIRPAFYGHAVFVDQVPSTDKQKTIPLGDIYVGVDSNKLYLYSKSYGKRIKIMHTTLLNVEMYPDISRFLIDVSNNHMCPTLNHFNWGKASRMPFLPRLEYKNLILSLARWRITKYTVPNELKLNGMDRFGSSVKTWRDSWMVPRFVYLIEDYDSRLLIDLESDTHLELLYHKITHLNGEDALEVMEAYPYERGIRLRDGNSTYLPEFIIPLMKNKPTPHKMRKPDIHDLSIASIKPKNWVFVKLYMKEELEDAFITGDMVDMLNSLQKSAKVKGWFFIKYADPQHHIRFRVETTDSSINDALSRIYGISSGLVGNGVLSKFSIDTYVREVHRYGGLRGTEISEKIFQIDSAISVKLLEESHTLKYDNKILLCAASADRMLDGMGINPKGRMELYRSIANSISDKAGNAYKKNIKELTDMHDHKGQLHKIISKSVDKRTDAALAKRFNELKSIFHGADSKEKVSAILGSYLHMHCNRQLGINREDENEVYILLKRYSEILCLSGSGNRTKGKRSES